MRGKIVLAGLILSLSGVVASAQSERPPRHRQTCIAPGTITNESIPRDTYVITGEGSNYKITFDEGDYVYLNKGASQGVKVGDEFSVSAPVEDPTEIDWSKWQTQIIRKLGTWWEDRRARAGGGGAAEYVRRSSGKFLQLRAARRHRAALQGAAGSSYEVGSEFRPFRAV